MLKIENNYITIKETGRDYDFIATVQNKKEQPIQVIFIDDGVEPIEIGAYDWVGLLADSAGREQFDLLRLGLFYIKEE